VTRDYHCRPGAPNETAASTVGMERSRCTPLPNRDTGEVIGDTAARHTRAQLVASLGTEVASQPTGREIHITARDQRCLRRAYVPAR
jgi:hypothetical protein